MLWMALIGCRGGEAFSVPYCGHETHDVFETDAREAEALLGGSRSLAVEVTVPGEDWQVEADLAFDAGAWERWVFRAETDDPTCPAVGTSLLRGDLPARLEVHGVGVFEGELSTWVDDTGLVDLQGSIDAWAVGLPEDWVAMLRENGCAARAGRDELYAVWSFGSGGLALTEPVGRLEGALGSRGRGCAGAGAGWRER